MARTRDISVDPLVVAAASSALLAGGYDGLSVDDLAHELGIAKTTIYRRWPTKNHLVAAVVALWQEQVPIQSDEGPEANLVGLVAGIAASVSAPGMHRVVGELVGASVRDADLRGQLQQLWGARRHAAIADLQAAIDGGLLRSDLDPALLIDQLAGAVYYRLLISGDDLGHDYPARVVRSAIAGAAVR